MSANARALSLVILLALAFATPSTSRAAGPAGGAAAWDSVAAILQTKDVFAGGYHRFNLPRRDFTLHLGDVTVAPELAQGAWVGFSAIPTTPC